MFGVNPLVVVAVIVAIGILVALAATNPMMRKREDGAIAVVKGHLGADKIDLIEPRTTAMGTEPDEANGVRGMACLGLSDAEVMAVTWVGTKQWRIPRAAVLSVDSPADDPTVNQKSTITMTYARPEGGEATAMFRVRDASDWLTALGYDWGDDGPPLRDDDDIDEGTEG